MEFRWIALITLWTLLAGPVFDSPLGIPKGQQTQTTAAGKLRSSR